MAMNLSLIIKATDRASGTIARITSATRGLADKGLGRVATMGRQADGVISRLGAGAAPRLQRLLGSVANLAGRAGLGGLKIAAIGSLKVLQSLLATASRLAIVGVGAGAYAGGRFIGDVIGMSSKMEQFQVILENTEGSSAKAKKAMEWVKNFGKTTPYEVGEVMEAFVKMRAYGIDPTNGSLTSLGNAASGMGKELSAAIEMIADAQTGEFERLKEFGIKAKQAGDQVTFSWSKNGKDMTRTSKKSANDIRKTITGIFDENFGGMMDRQSRTLAGMWSNIKDAVANFELDTGNAGFFDFVKGKVQQLLAWVNKLGADGTLTRWAKTASDWLTLMAQKAADFIENTDWAKVGADLQRIGGDLLAIVNALSWIIEKGRAAGNALSFAANPAGAAWSMAHNLWEGTRPRAPVAVTPQASGWRAGMKSGPSAPAVQWPGGARPAAKPQQSNVHIMLDTKPGTRATVTAFDAAPGTKITTASRGHLSMSR